MIQTENGIETLQFASLQGVNGLRHAVTTRAGGVSEGGYASLNLGFHVQDDAACVRENRQRLARDMGYEAEALVAAQQVHGAGVALIGAASQGRGALDWESALPATDALIVTEPHLPAMILVADCAPLILADKATGVFALVHAGWRGAVARIASQTVEAMENELGARPGEIAVGIGPHLCRECFEIGGEVAREVQGVAPEAIVSGRAKPHLDLDALLRHDLQSAGISSHNMETMRRCPRCDNETFFSHRAQGGKAGRFALVAYRQ